MLGYHSVEAGSLQSLHWSSRSTTSESQLMKTVMYLRDKLASSFAVTTPLESYEETTPATHTNSAPAAFQQQLSRLEREIVDLRQQQNLLARDKQEDSADLSNILAEMSTLKQRLARTLAQAETQLFHAKEASLPAQLQSQVSQLLIEANWLYATVNVDHLPYYASPSTTSQPVGMYSAPQRILILYKTVENPQGLWMQTRQAQEPEKRYWFRLVDEAGAMAVGHFGVLP